MLDLIDDMLDAMQANETDIGNPTFSWKNNTYGCVAGSINDSVKSDSVGFNETADFKMKVRTSQFTTGMPQLNDYIYFGGYKMLIKNITKPFHQYWVFTLEIPTVSK